MKTLLCVPLLVFLLMSCSPKSYVPPITEPIEITMTLVGCEQDEDTLNCTFNIVHDGFIAGSVIYQIDIYKEDCGN